MMRDDQIRTLIYRAIDRVNEVLRPAEAVAKSKDTVLMGDAQAFDSMGFVTFMAALEDDVSRTTGREISVVDTMFADKADHWTVETLARRIAELVDPSTELRAGPSTELRAGPSTELRAGGPGSVSVDEASDTPLVVGFPRVVRSTPS
ncbi:MAG: hypothetical protein HYS05_19805 [Acidobacteria bacterium]|nr:hypothetical protein [Acidobacteriota bacterium]